MNNRRTSLVSDSMIKLRGFWGISDKNIKRDANNAIAAYIRTCAAQRMRGSVVFLRGRKERFGDIPVSTSEYVSENVVKFVSIIVTLRWLVPDEYRQGEFDGSI